MSDEYDKKDDESILKDARDFLSSRISSESEMRQCALDDLKFLVSEQWPEDVAASRKADNRPCITVNKLPVYLHQVTNDQRQNRSSIKVHPVDDDADEEIAEIEQGLIRHIEYDSNADVACDTAVNSAAAIGFGYWRLVTEYASPDSFDQEVKFKRIRNPFTVYLGSHTEPDASDMMNAIITEELDKEEFKRQYPNAELGENVERGIGDGLKEWLSKDKMRLAEFYRVEITPEKLYRTDDGKNVLEGDLQPGAQFALDAKGQPKTRMSERRKVCWYKITGLEVLERSEIKCNWIPVFPVYGDEFDVDGKIYRSGLIRNAKGPSQMYNVWMTAATEEIGLRPKIPYIGALGQFDSDKKWGNANVRSYPYMEYDPVSVDGNMAPAPQRQPMSDVPSGVLAMAMHAADDIKATTGIFNASLGAQGNETSGKAILARQKEGDVGSFHYTDNLNRSKRHCARCILWMIPFYYDTERVLRVMDSDETVKHVAVNKQIPPEQQQPDPETGAIKTVLNDLTVGKYDVTIDTGPSYTTQRQEMADAMINLGQSWPQLMQVAGDLLVKNMDWHNADKIAERIKRSIPPQIIGPDEDQPPIPPEVQDAMQQKDMQIQELTHALDEAHAQHTQLETEVKSGMQAEQIKSQTSSQIEAAKAQREAAAEQAKNQREAAKLQMEDQRERDKMTRELALKEADIQSKERAEQIKVQSAQVIAIRVAEINAEAKVKAAELAAASTLSAQQDVAAEEDDDKPDQKHEALMAAITQMTKVAGAPRKLVRGTDGKPQGSVIDMGQ